MWSRSKKARREAALAAAAQILRCKAELDNLKAELDKLRRPKKNDQLAIDGKNEPSVKQLLAKMDQLDEEGRKISKLLQFRRYDLEREVRIAEVARTPQLLSAKPSADPACEVVSSSLLDAARTGLRARSTVAQPRQAHNLAIALETSDHLSGCRYRFARGH
jgi:hypothetical protein